MKYETIIGLEIHCELKTKTKAFCSCPVTFGETPNTSCCPICVGMPGTLPVLNRKLVDYCIMAGLALNCKINFLSKNARKNYFYPDLAKGYQISQSEKPLCTEGFLLHNERKIRINRIHIEEDAGKLIHKNKKTYIDYNRAGVPLLEIVTEPDLRSPEETGEFLRRIKKLLVSLGISECKMHQGGFRCDVNVSVRKKGEKEYAQRVEMKNINSFSAVEECIRFERDRQIEILSDNGKIQGQTRKWNDEQKNSVLMREKETMEDYRYFPEPDIPEICITEEYIEEIKEKMHETYEKKVERYTEDFNLSPYNANLIARDDEFSSLFEEAVKSEGNIKIITSFITGELSRLKSEGHHPGISGRELAMVSKMLDEKKISYSVAKEIIFTSVVEKRTVDNIVKEKDFTISEDKKAMKILVKEILDHNEKAVVDYKRGKQAAVGFLMGLCMRKSLNKFEPAMLKQIIIDCLEGKND